MIGLKQARIRPERQGHSVLCAFLITLQIVHRSSPTCSGDHLVSHQGVDPRLLACASRGPPTVANTLEGRLGSLEGVKT
ncbi:MAG: hypothetical protein ACREA0_20085, partial [bacterium]